MLFPIGGHGNMEVESLEVNSAEDWWKARDQYSLGLRGLLS